MKVTASPNTQNVQEINAELERISPLIFPANMRLIYVHVDDLLEQDVNAQSMPKAMFGQLVANIKAAQAPESLPLVVKTNKGIEIISGHHRKRATKAAGINYLLCIMYLELPPSSIFAKQLGHNSISGSSDPELVKRIWQQITDVQARFESFIDPRSFETLKPVSFKPVDVDIQSAIKAIVIMFMPTQKIDFDAAIEAVMPKTDVDTVYVANRDVFDQFKAAIQRVRADLDIVHAPTALAVMAQLAMERLEQIRAESGEVTQE